MRRWLPALALVALLTGCASAGPSPTADPSEEPEPSASPVAEPVPRFIGAADDGSTFAMTVDQTTTLRVADAEASDPELDGSSVLVIAIVNVTASDGREWEVRAIEPGVSIISGTDGDVSWEITLSVSE